MVIAIISLLVSILLPSLDRARQQAQAVVCSANLRQFGLALHTYAEDHEGTLPILDGPLTPGSTNWPVALSPYLGVDWATHTAPPYTWPIQPGLHPAAVWQCPADSAANFMDYAANYPNLITYTGNYINWQRPPWKIEQIRRPGDMLAFVDSASPGQVYAFGTLPYGLPADLDFDGDGYLDTHAESLSWGGTLGHPYNAIGVRHMDRQAQFVCADAHAERWHIRDLAANKADVWGQGQFQQP